MSAAAAVAVPAAAPSPSPTPSSAAPAAVASSPPATPAAAPPAPVDRIAAAVAAVAATEPAAAAADEVATEVPAKPEAKPGEPSAAETRRKYLTAQKAERQARAAIKAARETTERAAAFQQATGNWQQDPAKLLRAANIDPAEFYREQTRRILAGDQAPPVDPVQAQIDAALQPYVEQLQQERLGREASQIIAQSVLPAIHAEQHEMLIQFHGGDPRAAAVAVWNAVRDHHERTGEVVPWDQAAAQIDAQCDKQITASLAILKGTKRYGKEFAAAVAAAVAAETPAAVVAATRRRPTTLTTRASGGGSTSAAQRLMPAKVPQSKDERIAAAVAAAKR